MGKKYRFYDPNQELLIPPNIHEWLPEGHLAFFVDKLIDNADISSITEYYERSDRGNPPYNPLMMTKILSYAYCIGMPSSRKINKAMYEDVAFRVLGAGNFPDFRTISDFRAFRVLGAGNFPDFRTISDFRKIHLGSLEDLFSQVLHLCEEADLVKLGTVAIDGTKVKANASIDKNYCHETLKEKEERLRKIVRDIFEEAEKIDEEEDRIYGRDRRGDELPEGFRTKKEQLERIQKAKEIIERKQREKKNKYDKKMKERAEKKEKTGKKLRGRKPKKIEDQPDESDKANITDPDSRMMKTRTGYVQGYNAQVAVDCDSQVIIATDLTQDCNDKNQLVPMMDKIKENTGKLPKRGTMDAGYDNEEQ
jgi:transposase